MKRRASARAALLKRRLPAVGVLALCVAACIIDPLDFTGKRCPCPEGEWVCTPAGTCATRESNVDVGPLEDGGAGEGALRVTNLRATWATASSIRWQWDVEGTRDNFGEYQLIVRSDKPDASGTRTWTRAESAELGVYLFPSRTGGFVLSNSTITFGHHEDTAYSATLVAVDSGGRRFTSNEAQAVTTTLPARRLVLFSETEEGASFLASFQPTKGCGANGTDTCLRYIAANNTFSECPNGDCYENLSYVNLNGKFDEINLDNSVAQFAYFEFQIRVEQERPSFWGEAWLGPRLADGGTCDDFHYCKIFYVPWSASPVPSYRVVQIPLRAMQRQLNVGIAQEWRPVTTDDFRVGLWGFNVGGGWLKTAIVDIDEVFIRY